MIRVVKLIPFHVNSHFFEKPSGLPFARIQSGAQAIECVPVWKNRGTVHLACPEAQKTNSDWIYVRIDK